MICDACFLQCDSLFAEEIKTPVITLSALSDVSRDGFLLQPPPPPGTTIVEQNGALSLVRRDTVLSLAGILYRSPCSMKGEMPLCLLCPYKSACHSNIMMIPTNQSRVSRRIQPMRVHSVLESSPVHYRSL